MSTRANDIAVIGIGCRFPGADSADKFYDNLLLEQEFVQEIPNGRWRYDGLYAKTKAPNRISSRWGGFIDDVEMFDARFFRILPSEAELLDPQQKLFLTCSWEALEDAGYARREATAGRPVGVYAGVTWNEFSLYANEYGYLRDDYKGAGSLYWGIPNRVSYFFDFVGPSIAIDTACSSSLVAVHLAAQGLLSGECEMALAGGVNLNLHPTKYLFLSSANFLSSEGRCRGFGAGGDGYVPSEGVGVLVLKTVAAAQEAGDRIYGVIKSTATNHGGKATGYTVPNPRAHQSVIATALQRAGANARDVSYVECHGTGTDLGDPIEITGLRLAFEETTGDRQFCGIGTVKSNIGHCEAAAGVAGMIKVLQSMRHGELPSTRLAETPNPKIDFDNSPFYLVQHNSKWVGGETPLLAGLSSFGAGGSNCHCILQSAPGPAGAADETSDGAYALPLSAANAERAAAYCRRLVAYIERHPDVSLADLSHTFARRETFSHRLVIIASTRDGLRQALGQCLDVQAAAGVYAAPSADDEAGLSVCADWAQAWLRGESALSALPRVAHGNVVSAPGYPLEKVRSWPHTAPVLYEPPPQTNAVLHPLIDRNLSTRSSGVFEKALRRDEYFVAEHWITNDPVLPGVCVAEMAHWAACHYLEEPGLSLSDIWFLEPISLWDRVSVDIQVRIDAAGDSTSFEVLSRGGSHRHASGKILMTPPPSRCPATVDLEAIFAHCDGELQADDVYARFAKSGIAQKGRFQVVTKFRYRAEEGIAILDLSASVGDDDAFRAHPTLMDGAVQAAMLHVFQRLPGTGTILPFQVGAYIRHRPLEPQVFAIARPTATRSLKYDVLICNSAGVLLAELQDFVLKAYDRRHEATRATVATSTLRETPLPATMDPRTETVGAVCVLSSKTLAPLSSLPSGWTLVPWDEITSWVQGLATGPDGATVERLVLVIEADPVAPTAAERFAATLASAKRVFELVQTMVAAEFHADVMICVLDPHGVATPLAQGIVGLLKCLNLELKGLRLRLLHTDTALPDSQLFRRLSNEFASVGVDAYVRYQFDRRLVESFEELTLDDASVDESIQPSAWVVTGAGGELGSRVARRLLDRGQSVVLMGRSPMSDRLRAELTEEAADRWCYVQCDLTLPSDVGRAVAEATTRFTGPWALVHCAGVIHDGAFLTKTWDTFERVMSAKVLSLLLLSEAMSGHGLSRVLLFSSMTALLGNRGQSDYAFANGFLDGLPPDAGGMLASDAVVTAVDWPYWAEGGMRIDAEKLPAYTESFLSEPLPQSVGLEVFDLMSSAAGVRACVMYGIHTIGELNKRLSLKVRPELSAAASVTGHDVVAETVVQSSDHGQQERKQVIQTFLFHFLERELKLDLTEEDLEVEFTELGVDSIAQMDLITKLEKEQGFPTIPQTLMVDNTNIAALTDFFYRHHRNADYRLN